MNKNNNIDKYLDRAKQYTKTHLNQSHRPTLTGFYYFIGCSKQYISLISLKPKPEKKEQQLLDLKKKVEMFIHKYIEEQMIYEKSRKQMLGLLAYANTHMGYKDHKEREQAIVINIKQEKGKTNAITNTKSISTSTANAEGHN